MLEMRCETRYADQGVEYCKVGTEDNTLGIKKSNFFSWCDTVQT